MLVNLRSLRVERQIERLQENLRLTFKGSISVSR